MTQIDRGRIEKAVQEIIEALGEDPLREGLVQTPERVAAFYAEVFDGLHKDPGEVVDAFFDPLAEPGARGREQGAGLRG